MRGRVVPRLVLLVVLVVGAALALRRAGLAHEATPERLQGFVQGLGAVAPLAYVGLYTLRGALVVVPASVLSIAGGLAFGPALGTLYTVIGATGSAVVSYLIARWLGRGAVERLLRGRAGRLGTFDEQAARRGFSLVLFTRLVPLVPFDVISFGAGLSGIRLRHFTLGTLLGIVPGSAAYSFLGSSLMDIRSPRLVAALIALGLLAAAAPVYRLVTKNVTALQEMHGEARQAATGTPAATPRPGVQDSELTRLP